MDKYVDKSLGNLNYLLTITRGKNHQVTNVIQYIDDAEHQIDGDFILTVAKNAVILTRNREPVFVKRWTHRKLESYFNESNITPLVLAGIKIAEVYQDSDGWIWEGLVDDNGNYFNIKVNNELLYTISF